MKGQSGFTLIEALVTGIISAGFAGVILSLFYMNNTQIIEGTRKLQLSQNYSLVSDQIKQSARRAAFAWHTRTPPNPPVITTTYFSRHVYFFDENRNLLNGYTTGTFSPDPNYIYQLKEWNTGATVFTPFKIRGDLPTRFKVGGNYQTFGFLTGNKGIEFHLTPVLLENGNVFALNEQYETVLFRNAIH